MLHGLGGPSSLAATGSTICTVFNAIENTTGIAEFDTHDNLFTPQNGFYYNFSMTLYRYAIGSDIDYDSYALEGLNYFPLTDALRAGVRLSGEVVNSDETPPPFATPILSLRGISATRYQGTHVGVVEAELTWEIDTRWSVLGFGGVGRTSNSASAFGSVKRFCHGFSLVE